MLNTLTSATFKYRGHYVTAQRMVESLNGKFFCWQGFIDNHERWSVAHKSLTQFEKQFQLLTDQMEKQADVTTFLGES